MRRTMDHPTSKFYGIRPINHDDIDYMTRCWLRGQWDEAHIHRIIHKDIFYQQHHRILEALYKAPNVTWLVAHDLERPNYILGWLCGELTEETPILHYLYTRNRFRARAKGPKAVNVKLSIATTLWQTWLGDHPIGDGGQYTHISRDWRPFLRHLGLERKWLCNPYALYYRLPGGWQEGFLSRDAPDVWLFDKYEGTD